MNQYTTWFGRVVWLGVLANVALALPTLFLPDEMLAMMSLPSASPGMWPSFAALLLILLSLFYIPAAISPLKVSAGGMAGRYGALGRRHLSSAYSIATTSCSGCSIWSFLFPNPFC